MGRAPCCDKANVKRGPWSPDEDSKLKNFIEKNGTGGNWIALPPKAGLRRCGKSCRLRWLNYLRPNIKHGDFSDDEDRIIFNLFATIGSRWSIIAAQLPGRTDNDIKNYWNTKLKKKIMGSIVIPSSSHQRKPTYNPNNFPLLNHHLQTPLTIPVMFNENYDYTTTRSSFMSLLDEPITPKSSSFKNINSMMTETHFEDFQENGLMSSNMHLYEVTSYKNSLIFGSSGIDQLSSSSSNESCNQIHGNSISTTISDMIMENNYLYEVEDNHENPSSELFWEDHKQLLGFGVEEDKQLVSSSSNSDENKTQGRVIIM